MFYFLESWVCYVGDSAESELGDWRLRPPEKYTTTIKTTVQCVF